MKLHGWSVAAALAAGMVLQGCASNGGVVYAPGASPEATAATSPVVVAIHDESGFNATRAQVERQMQPGGRFISVTSAERADVNGRFDDMAVLFGKFGDLEAMGPTARARIDDDQKVINTVLAARDGDRLVCRDEMQIGSHLPKRECRTLRQLQAERAEAARVMRRSQEGNANRNHGQ